jgi:hypothetical protein
MDEELDQIEKNDTWELVPRPKNKNMIDTKYDRLFLIYLLLPRYMLQSLQGKENFLRQFIPNYIELMKGFTRLLKKVYDFLWDDAANKSFEALKLTLTRKPPLFPPDYSQDYFLYLATSDSTIAMVLVQEDDSHDEHMIYYLSQSLTTTETKYLLVEKLALAAVQVVQRFRHYILLRRTIVISDCNPMQHILTRKLLGVKYSKWIDLL